MTRFGVIAPLVAAFLLTACGNPAIPPPQNYATVYGRVYDTVTNTGIGGALISIDVVNTVTSGPDGSFSASNVPIGPTDVTVQPPNGYARPSVPTFSVIAGDGFQLNIPLTPAP